MPGKKSDFALILWANGSTTILPCGLIKLSDRVEGKSTKLYWSENGEKKLNDAKIIKICRKFYNIQISCIY